MLIKFSKRSCYIDYMLTKSRLRQGFALPSVVIASVVLLMILVTAIAAISSARVALDAQYYQGLARDAAEAGTAFARDCLSSHSGIATWSSAKPLTPSTDCNGNTKTGCSGGCYVVDTATIKTSFTVGDITQISSGSYKMQAQGTVNLIRKVSGGTAKSVQSSYSVLDRYIDAPQSAGGAGFQDNGHIGFFVSVTGQLYGYGDNSAGQLGSSSLGAYIATPQPISLPVGVNKVNRVYTSGYGASIVCIIGDNLKAYCRGKPGAGEVGLMPQTEGWFEFVLPAGQTAQDLVMHGQGADGACVITASGNGYCAGDNWAYNGSNGNLGTNNTTDTVIPISSPERFQLPAGLTVKSMYIQDRITCAIASNDSVYCAGNNYYGTLGDGGSANSAVPKLYPLPGGRKASQVIGEYHNSGASILHVLATDGTIWGSGRNVYGELGDGTIGTARRTPVQYGVRSDYVYMLTGPSHFCGMTGSGDVYCAGDNSSGQLGTGACVDSSVPVRFNLPAGELASQSMSRFASSQFSSTQILTRSGKVYGSGANVYGKLGNNASSATQCAVVQMQMPGGITVNDITTLDADSTYVFGSNGAVYAVGRNNLGQLGDGTTTNRLTPVSVILPRFSSAF
jgi:alpha-tubulin suppressor-like RCC1 family protein